MSNEQWRIFRILNVHIPGLHVAEHRLFFCLSYMSHDLHVVNRQNRVAIPTSFGLHVATCKSDPTVAYLYQNSLEISGSFFFMKKDNKMKYHSAIAV